MRRRDLQRRWAHEARDEDPDNLRLVLAEITEDFERMLVELRGRATAEGVDLDAPIEPEPVRLDAVRLRRAGQELATSVGDEPELPDGELASTALVVAMKSARIATYLGEPRDSEAWTSDAVPNLLLLEVLLRDLREGLACSSVCSATRTLAEVDRLLEPLIASVDAPARRLLARLAEQRAAPSPFCRTDRGRPRGLPCDRESVPIALFCEWDMIPG